MAIKMYQVIGAIPNSSTANVHSAHQLHGTQRQKPKMALKKSGDWHKRKVAWLMFIHSKVAWHKVGWKSKLVKCRLGWPNKFKNKLTETKI